jgi:hypothetical protein
MFSTFLFNKLSRYRNFYDTETEFIEHLISGEVTIPVKDVLGYVDEYHSELPSKLQIRQVAKIQFNKDIPPLTGTIQGVHFFEGKVKYDVAIWLDDDSSTRIYNVDGVFVSPA